MCKLITNHKEKTVGSSNNVEKAWTGPGSFQFLYMNIVWKAITFQISILRIFRLLSSNHTYATGGGAFFGLFDVLILLSYDKKMER